MNKIIQSVKEFFTAYAVDGKIYGCSENSICWYHEKGHLERFKNKTHLTIYGYICLLSTPVLFLTKEYDIIFYSVSATWAFVLLFYEIDAWIYAFKHYHERIIGNNQP